MSENFETKVFETDLQRKTLENLLENLDNIIPKWVNREEYNSKKGEILQRIGEGKFQDFYDLYLPIDLKIGEIIYVINYITAKFNLQNIGALNNLLSYVKIIVGIVLREEKDNGEETLKELVNKYNIPKDFVEKLKPQKEGGKAINFETANFANQLNLNKFIFSG